MKVYFDKYPENYQFFSREKDGVAYGVNPKKDISVDYSSVMPMLGFELRVD